MKSKKVKRRRTKRIKGGILGTVFDTIYPSVRELSKKPVALKELMDIPQSTELSESDWTELIAESYFRDGIQFQFDDSELGRELSRLIDYRNPESLIPYRDKIVTGIRPRALSISQTRQGRQGTCFAHSASLLIFHNLYNLELTEEDKILYEENKCNIYLDTTREYEDFDTLRTKCGVSGAKRILLFLYIYKIIVDRFGCYHGNTSESIHFYLISPLKDFFPEINDILIPSESEKDSFEISNVDMSTFAKMNYKPFLRLYFQDYYASIHLKRLGHVITIINIGEDGIIGKDSEASDFFTIPFKQFHPKGIFTLKGMPVTDMSYITFFYKKTKLRTYPLPFARLLSSNVFTGIPESAEA
jgi:hypothetical protein